MRSIRTAASSPHRLDRRAECGAWPGRWPRTGAPPAAFDRFEPWFVSMTLTVLAAQRLGISAANGPETVLIGRGAGAQHADRRARRTRMADPACSTGCPRRSSSRNCCETLAQNDELDEKLAPMLAAWSRGDVERLAALMDENERRPTERCTDAVHRPQRDLGELDPGAAGAAGNGVHRGRRRPSRRPRQRPGRASAREAYAPRVRGARCPSRLP